MNDGDELTRMLKEEIWRGFLADAGADNCTRVTCKFGGLEFSCSRRWYERTHQSVVTEIALALACESLRLESITDGEVRLTLGLGVDGTLASDPSAFFTHLVVTSPCATHPMANA